VRAAGLRYPVGTVTLLLGRGSWRVARLACSTSPAAAAAATGSTGSSGGSGGSQGGGQGKGAGKKKVAAPSGQAKK
jgi:hypothetical protein